LHHTFSLFSKKASEINIWTTQKAFSTKII